MTQDTVGHLFFKGYKFHESIKKEVQGNYFHKSTLVSSHQSASRVTIKFSLIFGEINFIEVSKIREICSPRKKVPYSTEYNTHL